MILLIMVIFFVGVGGPVIGPLAEPPSSAGAAP
jgi:hypothetical protein